jgi:hypothetical protein
MPKLRPAIYILRQKATIRNTCRVATKFMAGQRIRSAWSVRSVLFENQLKPCELIIIIIIIIIDSELWYEHVPKSVETSQVGRQPYYGINKCKPTEPSPTINRTS